MARLKVWFLAMAVIVVSLASVPARADAQLVVRVGPHRRYHHRYYHHHHYYRHGHRYHR